MLCGSTRSKQLAKSKGTIAGANEKKKKTLCRLNERKACFRRLSKQTLFLVVGHQNSLIQSVKCELLFFFFLQSKLTKS